MRRLFRFIVLCSVSIGLLGCCEKGTTVIYPVESESSEMESAESISEADITGKTIFVDLSGAVVNPGVYEVPEGSRIYEVIHLAGGLLDTADVDYLNQAVAVSDGQKVYIKTWEETAMLSEEDIVAGPTDTPQDTDKININTASVTQLMTISGIGQTRAERIVAYREENGMFSSIEEIQKVSGIKEGLFQKIKDEITVGVN